MHSFDEDKNRLADELLYKGHVRTASVEAAFRAVARHLFVPEVAPDRAYRDEVIPLEVPGKEVASAASQPAIVAQMLEQLAVEPGDRVLEVGAATGYNVALMSHLVGEAGRVVTVEIDEILARRARESLDRTGFGERVEVIHADGGQGHPEVAPYDRIIVTVAAPDIVPAWRQQLAPEGRLVLPLELWPGLQVCAAFEPTGDHLVSVSAAWCGFLSMGGEFAAPEEIEVERSREQAASRTTLEARMRGLRAASLASGLPFPEWFLMRAYPRELGYVPDSEELVVEKRWSRIALDQL